MAVAIEFINVILRKSAVERDTTVGVIRAAGGDVVRTSGRSPNHATLVGLPPEEASHLLTPTIPNPAKKP